MDGVTGSVKANHIALAHKALNSNLFVINISRFSFMHRYTYLILFMAGHCALLTPEALADDIEWKVLEEAHEVIDISNIQIDPTLPVATYKSADEPGGEDTEIPDEAWPSYEPTSPFIKNTTRNLQFNESHFIASPDAPDGVTTYVMHDGYSWAAMSKAINAMWPYRRSDYGTVPSSINAYYAGNFTTTPPAGVVKVTPNFKAQDMKWWANQDGVPPGTSGATPLERYLVTDQWGNRYIMHASGQTDQANVRAAFDAAVLPKGWTKRVIELEADLILNPARGSDGSYHYLVFRDSADNTYHQNYWSGWGSLATQLSGMPIWGGQSGEPVSGDSDNDVIHGAGGNDRVSGQAGDDQLWGDAGDDSLDGGQGSDMLYGNEGRDLLSGGAGWDRFVFLTSSDSVPGNKDVLIDFVGGVDKIDLSAIDANSGQDGDQSFTFIGKFPFTGTAGQLRLTPDNDLAGDVNGDRKADFAIRLMNVRRVSTGDIIR